MHKFSIKNRDIEYSYSSKYKSTAKQIKTEQSNEINLVKKVTGISIGDGTNRFLKVKIPKMMVKSSAISQIVEAELEKSVKLGSHENPILTTLSKFNTKWRVGTKNVTKLSSEIFKKTADYLQKDHKKLQTEQLEKINRANELLVKPKSFQKLQMSRNGMPSKSVRKKEITNQKNAIKLC